LDFFPNFLLLQALATKLRGLEGEIAEHTLSSVCTRRRRRKRNRATMESDWLMM